MGFRQISFYLPEQFRQISSYLPEQFRQITSSFKKKRTFFWLKNLLSYTIFCQCLRFSIINLLNTDQSYLKEWHGYHECFELSKGSVFVTSLCTRFPPPSSVGCWALLTGAMVLLIWNYMHGLKYEMIEILQTDILPSCPILIRVKHNSIFVSIQHVFCMWVSDLHAVYCIVVTIIADATSQLS